MNVATLIAVLGKLPPDADVAAYEGESNGLNVTAGSGTTRRSGFIDLFSDEAGSVAHDLKEFEEPPRPIADRPLDNSEEPE